MSYLKVSILIGYLGLITWLSLAPNLPGPAMDWPYKDKVGHALAYAVLTALAAWVFSPKEGLTVGGFFWGFGLAIVCGATLEVLQGVLTTKRCMEWGDMFANVLGAALALFLGLLWIKLQR